MQCVVCKKEEASIGKNCLKAICDKLTTEKKALEEQVKALLEEKKLNAEAGKDFLKLTASIERKLELTRNENIDLKRKVKKYEATKSN